MNPLSFLQRAVHEGNSFKASSEALQKLCETYVLRSYVAMGKYETALEEVSAAENPSIGAKAVGLHAKYLLKPSQRDSAVRQLCDWLTDVATANDATLRLTTAVIYFSADDYKSALKVLGRPNDLEQ